MKLLFEPMNKDVIVPTYAHDFDAGADVYMYKDTIIYKGKNVINLGFKLIIPAGFSGFLSLRSSIMGNGITCNMVPFDAGYEGEWNLIVYNHGDDFVVRRGERICQIVIMPVIQAEFVKSFDNLRGEGGRGSTGK